MALKLNDIRLLEFFLCVDLLLLNISDVIRRTYLFRFFAQMKQMPSFFFIRWRCLDEIMPNQGCTFCNKIKLKKDATCA